jgi:hypothetical protein
VLFEKLNLYDILEVRAVLSLGYGKLTKNKPQMRYWKQRTVHTVSLEKAEGIMQEREEDHFMQKSVNIMQHKNWKKHLAHNSKALLE